MDSLDHDTVERLIEVIRSGPAESLPAPEGYDILDVVGEGGMGTVYRAIERRLGRTVAFKVGRDPSPEFLRRFESEARITAELEHPSVPPVFDLGQLVDGRAYYTMRLVDGRNLRAVVREAYQTQKPGERVPSLLRTVANVCDVVDYAHTRSIVHRDLKPENVLLGDFGEVWVIDWGLGKVLDEPARSPEEVTSQTVGTPTYMAPEQALGGEDATSAATDVYALGCMVFEVIEGRPPFGKARPDRVLERLRAGEGPSLSFASRTPRPLQRIAAKALAPRPGARYATAHALAEDLRRYLDGLSVDAYPERPLERVWRGIVRHRVAVGLVTTYAVVRLVILLAFGR